MQVYEGMQGSLTQMITGNDMNALQATLTPQIDWSISESTLACQVQTDS
jgi:hypothetical protein